MTCLLPLLLGCHIESNHSYDVIYLKVPKTSFSASSLAFAIYIKVAFYIIIPRYKPLKETVCPWKIFFLLYPFTFTVAKIIFSFCHLESIYNLKCSIKKRMTVLISKVFEISKKLSFNLAGIVILLIVMSNTSILNPGPTKINGLSCYFHNVQGLITISSLGKPFPDLNQTKICELQAHIFSTSPDVVILNETWLKSTITNNEILPEHIYKSFRLDRSSSSHPIDPSNPKKFKSNGGGVLIAIKNSLNSNPKIIKYHCKAEVSSVELTFPNRKKICLSTVYRVGTLGKDNFKQLQHYYNSIFESNKFKHILIIGDFNLDTINWDRCCTSDSTHTLFLDLFRNLGLSQFIHTSTHKHNNILDILLFDSPNMLDSLCIHEPGSFLNSDHSPITFTIKSVIHISKPIKRTIYNYKKANWNALNNDLSRIDWEFLLRNTEVHIAWQIFKNKLTYLCVKHIPKIKIKDNYQPPWYDSDVFRLNKKKEYFWKLYKQSKCQNHYDKYSSLRKSLKALIKSKVRSNFDDDLSSNTITKKFWSYVKSSNKTSRIPDKIFLGDCYRNTPKEVADLFNQHFYNQFSDESNYDINIDFSNDTFFDFTIRTDLIYQQLSSLNPNKSMGPDNLSGQVLKSCAQSIALPLQLIFNLSFKTGSIPSEWKLAHIIPIHKKDDKNDIENYRPISLTCIVSKIFEKCVRDELLIQCQHLIHVTQHGFLPLKSCTTQLIPFSHDISLGLNSNNLIDVI